MAKQLKANFFTVSVLKGSPIQLSPPIVDNLRNNDYSYCYPNDPSFDSYLLKKQLSKILKETSGPQIRFYPGNLDSHLLTFYQNEFRADSYYPCYFPWSAFNISPHGDVFPCLALKVGNIREQSLNQIWNGSKMRTFRVKLKKNKIFPACNGCCNLWMKNK
jgi:radical SAM protein with 4Fe4S-binding SPASM domain